MIVLAPSPFEIFAQSKGLDTAPAVLPCPLRQYADRDTQKAFEAYKAGATNTARMVTKSTLETESLKEKRLAIAGSE